MSKITVGFVSNTVCFGCSHGQYIVPSLCFTYLLALDTSPLASPPASPPATLLDASPSEASPPASLFATLPDASPTTSPPKGSPPPTQSASPSISDASPFGLLEISTDASSLSSTASDFPTMKALIAFNTSPVLTTFSP
ncbi:hypothetical protein GOP47_0020108 [Adiantum capillus-veneris]|uniref:Uncharacterized protein n=1 Tax=Adiantum capillus-veneris TaxID=13818 RepID=A0A9D4UCC6_ADICA|nr:hypothetical protein GOP47_0020108 [Adiantum capillus-veneris]